MQSLIEPRGPAPAVAPSRFDIPILVNKAPVPGSGPRVDVHMTRQRSGVFDDSAYAEFDMTLAREAGLTLHNHYRGHLWSVEVDSRQGVCFITIPILLGNWKYIIPLKMLNPAMVIKAGGEILERFNLPRSRIDFASFLEARGKSVSRASQRPPGS
jgi:hypothetical protein